MKITSKKIKVESINLDQMNSWQINNETIFHDSKILSSQGKRVSSDERKTKPDGINQYQEVNFDGGLLGLIRAIKDGYSTILLRLNLNLEIITSIN